MTMDIRARHTKIVEKIDTQFGTLVREDYYGYPRSESNLYMVDAQGKPIWFAERVANDDSYANPIRQLGECRIKCASWNGFDCEIDIKSGKLIDSAFTK
jgi:hypothetical protein